MLKSGSFCNKKPLSSASAVARHMRDALPNASFIEEQIFNWTYTDEQRAKEEFAKKNPGHL